MLHTCISRKCTIITRIFGFLFSYFTNTGLVLGRRGIIPLYDSSSSRGCPLMGVRNLYKIMPVMCNFIHIVTAIGDLRFNAGSQR